MQSQTLFPAQQQKSSPKSSAKKQQQHVVNRYGQVAGASAATAVTQPGGPRDSDALFPTLASEKDLIALQKAEEQRERLLDYQRNSTARTRVFDTASDFDFQSDVQNKWLTAEERAIALKNLKEQERLEEERKKSRVISIDLQNRRVIHEPSLPNSTGLPDRRQLSYEAAKSSSIFNSHAAHEQNVHSEDASAVVSSLTSEPGSTGLFLNPTVRIAPKYIPPTPPAKESSKSTSTSTSSSKQSKPNKNQIQPWKAGEIDKENSSREKPATMKQMRELLAASGELQETEAIGHQFTAAMQAKKLAAKREAEARKYLKVERRRVQDDYDFESSSWNISSGVDGPGDEPACG
ncbi:hypothetical protein BDR26DRAFT_824679 [Obelidium mucronatum]|nr:hypothetical protein BDR26DRAFT_824679 [Obelidium mucronatum]